MKPGKVHVGEVVLDVPDVHRVPLEVLRDAWVREANRMMAGTSASVSFDLTISAEVA